jgi:hypothetical protein
MWALIAVAAAVMLGTVADRLPALNRLPLIGAPRPEVRFRVNGSSKLVVRLARPRPVDASELPPELRGHAGRPRDPEPRTAQIEVEVRNPSSFERIDRALVNFLLPVGLLRKKTDASGNRRETGGEWLPTVDPRRRNVGAVRLLVAGRRGLRGWQLGPHVLRGHVCEEGEYPIRMRISAPTLYEKDYDTDDVIRVEVADDGPARPPAC